LLDWLPPSIRYHPSVPTLDKGEANESHPWVKQHRVTFLPGDPDFVAMMRQELQPTPPNVSTSPDEVSIPVQPPLSTQPVRVAPTPERNSPLPGTTKLPMKPQVPSLPRSLPLVTNPGHTSGAPPSPSLFRPLRADDLLRPTLSPSVTLLTRSPPHDTSHSSPVPSPAIVLESALSRASTSTSPPSVFPSVPDPPDTPLSVRAPPDDLVRSPSPLNRELLNPGSISASRTRKAMSLRLRFLGGDPPVYLEEEECQASLRMEAWSLHNRLRDQIDLARKGDSALVDRAMTQLSATEKILFQAPGILHPRLECGYYPLVAATSTRLRPHELTAVALGLHLDAQLNQWHFERNLESRNFRSSRVVSPKEESAEYILRDIQVEMTSLQRTSVAVFNNSEYEVIIEPFRCFAVLLSPSETQGPSRSVHVPPLASEQPSASPVSIWTSPPRAPGIGAGPFLRRSVHRPSFLLSSPSRMSSSDLS
jgi:hypothetical protein